MKKKDVSFSAFLIFLVIVGLAYPVTMAVASDFTHGMRQLVMLAVIGVFGFFAVISALVSVFTGLKAYNETKDKIILLWIMPEGIIIFALLFMIALAGIPL